MKVGADDGPRCPHYEPVVRTFPQNDLELHLTADLDAALCGAILAAADGWRRWGSDTPSTSSHSPPPAISARSVCGSRSAPADAPARARRAPPVARVGVVRPRWSLYATPRTITSSATERRACKLSWPVIYCRRALAPMPQASGPPLAVGTKELRLAEDRPIAMRRSSLVKAVVGELLAVALTSCGS